MLYQRLQSVQSAAGRLITLADRRKHNGNRSEGTALAVCPTPDRIQAHHAHVQDTAWPGTVVFCQMNVSYSLTPVAIAVI